MNKYELPSMIMKSPKESTKAAFAKAEFYDISKRAITKAMMHLAIRDRISGNIQYGDYVR